MMLSAGNLLVNKYEDLIYYTAAMVVVHPLLGGQVNSALIMMNSAFKMMNSALIMMNSAEIFLRARRRRVRDGDTS